MKDMKGGVCLIKDKTELEKKNQKLEDFLCLIKLFKDIECF